MGIRQTEMGKVNEYLVLEYLRDHQQTTRPQIAAGLRLSPASVSRIVAKLIDSKLVVESPGSSESSGRPRGVLAINLVRDCVVGIDLGGTKCHGVLSDLAGTALAEKNLAVADTKSAYDALTQIWKAMSGEAIQRGLVVGALAVGVPAVIDPRTELALRGPNVGWEGFELVAHVRALGLPFVVDNDVNLAATAEGQLGQALGCRDYAVLSLGTGLGGAVVADGRLVRGRNNAAGEVSMLLPHLAMIRERRVGGIGGLETVLTGPAIAARARDFVESDGAARSELTDHPTAQGVIERAIAGGTFANRIIDEVLDALALCVVTLAAVTDPEVVVIDGSVGRALAPFLPRVAKLVGQHTPTPPRLAVSRLGPNATVRGAIAAALQLLRATEAPEVLSKLAHDGVIQR